MLEAMQTTALAFPVDKPHTLEELEDLAFRVLQKKSATDPVFKNVKKAKVLPLARKQLKVIHKNKRVILYFGGSLSDA